jgi:hypothetical protein
MYIFLIEHPFLLVIHFPFYSFFFFFFYCSVLFLVFFYCYFILFTLAVVQDPIRARCCGFGEKDRRPIDPPPILELIAEDRFGKPIELK